MVFFPVSALAQSHILIPEQSVWKYLDTGADPGTLWNKIGFSEEGWKSGKGKLGYGEGDENTILGYGPDAANKFITYFFRISIDIQDPLKYRSLLIRLLRDDGAIVYINGNEVIRSNMPAVSVFSTLAVEGVGGTDEQTYFPFTVKSGMLVAGNNLIAVEVHQQTAGSSDLSFDLELSGSTQPLLPLKINEVMPSNASAHLDPDNNQFVDWIELYNGDPEPFILTGYFLTDDLDQSTKWSFPIGTTVPSGGYLVVYADGSNTALHTNFQLSKSGERIGIFNESGSLIDSLSYPPLAPNLSYGALSDGSSERGYFWACTAGSTNQGGIVNTQATPAPLFSLNAGFYQNSQTLELTCSDTEAVIRYTRDGSEPVPSSSRYTTPLTIAGNTVVKARAFRDSYLPSGIVTNTYFINEDIKIAVVSISIEQKYLDDSNVGIYLDDKLDIRRNWERPATLEFFEPDGTRGFLSNVDLRLFGRSAVVFPEKSFGVFIRPTNGVDGLNYNLFPGTPYNYYQSFVLRSSSDDWVNTMFRDGCLESLFDGQFEMIQQDYRPSILFINGHFMGIHNIRDKINPTHLATHKGIDPTEVDIIYVSNDFNPPVIDVKSGDDGAYWAMWNYITKNDMSSQANYTVASAMLDMDNFINFYSVQILTSNQSWRHNCKLWRAKTGDTRFKGTVWDLDYGYQFIDRNNLTEITANDPLLKSLVKNAEFKSKFKTRLDLLSQTVFSKDRSLHFIDSMAAVIEPYIQRHANKWQGTYPGAFASKAEWVQRVDVMRNFARNRETVHDGYIRSYFGVNAKSNFTVTITPPGSGKVYVNNDLLTESDFAGKFYNNTSIDVVAVPNPGYSFTGWHGIGSSNATVFPMLSAWKFLDDGTDKGNTWRNASYDDSGWKNGTGVLGYGETSGINTTIGFGPNANQKYITYYFRKEFTVSNPAQYSSLSVEVVRDDGAVIYLNGTEVARSNMPAGTITYTTLASSNIGSADEATVLTFPISPQLLTTGKNVIAVEIHQSDQTSGDLRFDLALVAGTSSLETSSKIHISVNQAYNITANFTTKRENPIVITEINYAPPTNLGDGMEYIELFNSGTSRVALAGYGFSGIDFTFPSNSYIMPGSHVLVAKNRDLFSYLSESAYQWLAGDLSNSGEEIVLRNGAGVIVDRVVYAATSPWPTGIAGSGYSIELADASSDNSLGANWKKSTYLGGSPGMQNPGSIYRDLRINEITGIPSKTGYLGLVNWFEVTNIGSKKVNLAGYYLSNDPNNPAKYKIPAGFDSLTVISPTQCIVFIAENTVEIGPLYTPFKLKGDGGSLLLTALAGDRMEIIDRVDYPLMGRGISYGRIPSGTGGFVNLSAPTPGKANRQTETSIIVASRIKSGDKVPVVVKIRNSSGDIDKTVNGRLQLQVTAGTIVPDTILVRNGMGSVMAKFTAVEDFEISITGYPYRRHVEVSSSIPQLTLTGPISKSVHLAAHTDYLINSDLSISPEGNLIVPEGVRLLIKKNIGISSNGRLEFTGTVGNPVVIMPIVDTTFWGGLEIHNVDSLSEFNWVMMGRGGGEDNKWKGHSYAQPLIFGDHANIGLDNVFMTDNKGKAMYTDYSNVHVNNSYFARSDMGPELRFSHGEFYNTWFLDMRESQPTPALLFDDNDALYFWEYSDFKNPHIVDNVVINTTQDDGIDMLTAPVIIRNSLFANINDKGVSAGYRSQVYVDKSVFALSTGGANCSFESYLHITSSTFYKTERPTYSYSASGDVTNCILSKHITSYSNDTVPSFYFDHCISDSDPNLLGTGNLYGAPGLKNPSRWDFTLAADSKSIDAGNPQSGSDPDGSVPDLGAFPFGGGAIKRLIFNEIYYRPPKSQGTEQAYEFIEIINISNQVLDISGFRLAGDVGLTFPSGTQIKPGEIILLASDRFTYSNLECQKFSWKQPGLLPNSPATIRLISNTGVLMDEISYSDALPWDPSADGLGYSLSLKDPYLDSSLPANWTVSYVFGGTPGMKNIAPDYSKLRINEYSMNIVTSASDPTSTSGSWVEVYNSSNTPINVGGLFWTNDPATPAKWKIPATKPSETVVPAQSCLLFRFTEAPGTDPLNIGYLLSLATPRIILNRQSGTQFSVIDQVTVQAANQSGSYGRYPNGTGNLRLFNYGSPGTPNDVGAKHIICPRIMRVGEYLPIVIMVDTLDGLKPKQISANMTILATNATLRSAAVTIVKGFGSLTTKIESAGSHFKLSMPSWNDTIGIDVAPVRHLVSMNNEQRFEEVWTSGHDYWIRSSITIPVGHKLVIQAGTRILMGSKAKIIINGSLEVHGTADNPVLFTPYDWAKPWGGIEFGQYAAPSALNYCFFIGGGADSGAASGHSASQAILTTKGGQLTVNGGFFIDNVGKAIYSEAAKVKISGSLISRNDAGIEGYQGRLEMDKSAILFIPNESQSISNTKEHDGIYLVGKRNDFAEAGLITNSSIGYTTDDAIDLLDKSGLIISGSYLFRTGDKGLSIAQNKVSGDHLVFDHCLEGVATREAGYAFIDHSTFYKNNVALRSYSNLPLIGHGHLLVSNSIISESVTSDQTKDTDNELTISYSLSDKSLIAGTGNKMASPQLKNPGIGDYSLAPGSQAIDSGDPLFQSDPDGTRSDMGALYYNRSSTGKMIINEIHYNPNITGLSEFIELVNSSEGAIDLNGYHIDDAVTCFLSQSLIVQPGEYVVLTKKASDYSGKGYKVIQWTSGDLADTGETISLLDPTGQLVDQVVYGAAGTWPALPVLYHTSIELKNQLSNNSLPESWRTSYYLGGTPGAENRVAPVERTFINEVLARNTMSLPDETGLFSDWIELYNQSGHFINVGGLFLTKVKTSPDLFRIPDIDMNSTLIPPGGFIEFWLDEAPQKGIHHVSFLLPGAGSFVGLAEVRGGLYFWIDSLSYPSLASDQSFGRAPDGNNVLIKFDQATPGLPNRAPRGKVSGLFINEVMARNVSTIRNNLGEFDDWIELYNSTTTAIDVGGLYLSDRADNLLEWKIPETRPDSTTIPSKDYLLFYPTAKTNAGVRHTNFQLAGGGEFVGLAQIVNGQTTLLDSVTYPVITSDVSYGRQRDADPLWIRFVASTPGYSNTGHSGFEDIDLSITGVRAYPNPASDHLWIELLQSDDKIQNVQITDILGNVVKEWNKNEIATFPGLTLYWDFGFSSTPENGVYFIVVHRSESISVEKFFMCRNNQP